MLFKVHSFTVWVASDPDVLGGNLWKLRESELFSVQTVGKYLTVIHTWHLLQGWPPLDSCDHQWIKFSLYGLAKLSSRKCSHPIHPPVIVGMLTILKATPQLDYSSDACIWAMATFTF